MFTINFTTKTVLYIPTTEFFIALYPKRKQNKLHQTWHDTLAPTQRPNGPISVLY